jgi:hypothetical protein
MLAITFNMVKIESRPQTIPNQVEIGHQLCESKYPEKVNDLYVQSIYMDEIRQCVETLRREPKLNDKCVCTLILVGK